MLQLEREIKRVADEIAATAAEPPTPQSLEKLNRWEEELVKLQKSHTEFVKSEKQMAKRLASRVAHASACDRCVGWCGLSTT